MHEYYAHTHILMGICFVSDHIILSDSWFHAEMFGLIDSRYASMQVIITHDCIHS